MELVYSKKFKNEAKKLVENKVNLKIKVNKVLRDFMEKGREASCYRKPLKGQWFGHEELQVGGDIRIIFRMNEDETRVVLERIGSHSQLGL